jgi:hypothetical protein
MTKADPKVVASFKFPAVVTETDQDPPNVLAQFVARVWKIESGESVDVGVTVTTDPEVTEIAPVNPLT